ncbi:MAG: NAD(P)-dependent glycerol-3-phosphate dehydrogenase [Gammaproteobacteria bacterium]|nr:NAD(P)-dependent glycerol-3-phosphate dehydrogenase [Gammaproteobacteria bacterium]
MRAEASVLVLGAGSWGTALALVLARHGIDTFLWDCDAAHTARLKSDRTNSRHLPGIPFPERLIPVTDLGDAPAGIQDVVVAVPCEGLGAALASLRAACGTGLRLCLASKGLEPATLRLNHEVALECLGPVPTAVLSGPSFAAEVARGLPTVVTIASTSPVTAEHFAQLFHSETFRIYTHDDVIGVQVGGAVKNVMAIAAGISDGLGFGANTRAGLITRGLAEIMRLGIAMGGRRDTFMGLAGLGDLVLTCTDDQSRNRRLGLALARGKSLEEARREIGQAIEGVRTAAVVVELARRHRIEMPISEQVQQVIIGTVTPAAAVQNLLRRERKGELIF